MSERPASAPNDEVGEDTESLDDWPVDPAYAPPLFEPGLEPQATPATPPQSSGPRWPAAMAAGSVVLVLLLGIALVWALSRPTAVVDSGRASSSNAASGIAMPRLIGMALVDARARMRAIGLHADVRRTPSSQPAGTIVAQSPAAATRVAATRPVVLLVAAKRSGLSLPSLVGLDLGQAQELLSGAGVRARVRRVASERPADTIVRHTPSSLTGVRKDQTVTLFVSSGAVEVPRVIGLHGDDAVLALRRMRLHVQTAAQASDRPDGAVIDQDPAAGTRIRSGATVRIVIAHHGAATTTSSSAGSTTTTAASTKVVMPRLVGLSLSEAVHRLHALGLHETLERVASTQDAGTILGQSAVAGAQLRRGMSVTLRVASRPPQVAVPDVVGLGEGAARQQLASAGFQVTVSDQSVSDPSQDGTVIAVSPSAGSSVAHGSSVTITVGRFTSDAG